MIKKLALISLIFFSILAFADGPAISGLCTINAHTNQPCVTAASATTMTVVWTTDVNADSLVSWSLRSDDNDGMGVDSGLFDNAGVTNHTYTITGLRPQTAYNVGIRNRVVGGPSNGQSTFWMLYNCCTPGSYPVTTPSPVTTGDYTINGWTYGPHHVMRGYPIYIGVTYVQTAGTAAYSTNSLKTAIGNSALTGGLPPGVTILYPIVSVYGGQNSGTYCNGTTVPCTYVPAGACAAGKCDTLRQAGVQSTNDLETEIELLTDVINTPVGGANCEANGGTTVVGYFGSACQFNLKIRSWATVTSGATNPCSNPSSGVGTVCQEFNYPIIIEPATPLATAVPTYFPAVPCKTAAQGCFSAFENPASWEGHFTYGCNSRLATATTAMWAQQTSIDTSTTQNFWYYDGLDNLLKIKLYTNNAACAGVKYTGTGHWGDFVSALQTSYTTKINGGGISQGFNMFPHGLYKIYCGVNVALAPCTTPEGAGADQTALNTLGSTAVGQIKNSNLGDSGARIDTTYVREVAYALNVFRLNVDAGTTCGTQNCASRRDEAFAKVLGHAEMIASGNARWWQPFMVGLMSRAIIEYYDDYGKAQNDPRPMQYLKLLNDYVFVQAWSPNAISYYDGPAPAYQTQPGSFFYNSYNASIGNYRIKGGNYYQDLNNLISPSYARLFRYTGNGNVIGSDNINCNLAGGIPCTYLQAFQTTWTSGVKIDPGQSVNWTGKNFSQNYYWSFDALTDMQNIISLTAYNYGNQEVGTNSGSQIVTFFNYGNVNITFTSIALTTGVDFSCDVGHACGYQCVSPLVPGASCNVSLTFTPTGVGAKSDTLTFTDSDSTSPQTVALSGTGIILPHAPTINSFSCSPPFVSVGGTYNCTISTTNADIGCQGHFQVGGAAYTINNITCNGVWSFKQDDYFFPPDFVSTTVIWFFASGSGGTTDSRTNFPVQVYEKQVTANKPF